MSIDLLSLFSLVAPVLSIYFFFHPRGENKPYYFVVYRPKRRVAVD